MKQESSERLTEEQIRAQLLTFWKRAIDWEALRAHLNKQGQETPTSQEQLIVENLPQVVANIHLMSHADLLTVASRIFKPEEITSIKLTNEKSRKMIAFFMKIDDAIKAAGGDDQEMKKWSTAGSELAIKSLGAIAKEHLTAFSHFNTTSENPFTTTERELTPDQQKIVNILATLIVFGSCCGCPMTVLVAMSKIF